MNLPVGIVRYTLGVTPVTGCGLSWTMDELDTALEGSVAEVVFDDVGTADLTALLESMPDTEFDPSEVKRILSDRRAPENWRVGESLAEAYLVHHRACNFPWPDSRDERKSGSSLPGADLVGFQQDGKTNRFAFGEVKTSSEATYPPGAMHGRTGLKQQIEDLRDEVSIRDDLVKYLGHRVRDAVWKEQFISAFKRYSANNADVQLFGILVRDVPPHEDDLRIRVSKLGTDCPVATSVELLAVYLPDGSIDTLSEKVMNSRKRPGA